MKNVLFAGAAAAALALSTSAASAQVATLSVNVSLTRALTVTSVQQVSFGAWNINSNSGDLLMTGSGTGSGCTIEPAGTGFISQNGNTHRCGEFTFVGPRPGNVGFTIVTPTIDLLHNQPESAPSGYSVVFEPEVGITSYNISYYNEAATVSVGGGLRIGNDTPEGSYSGNISINIDYV